MKTYVDADSFLDKICPLLNKKCIQEECAAFNKGNQIHYSSCGSEELEIKVPYKIGKHDTFLNYTIFEAIIDQKIIDKHYHCLQFKQDTQIEEIENINVNHHKHGNLVSTSTYNGNWLQLRKHNKDFMIAKDGNWEIEHNV